MRLDFVEISNFRKLKATRIDFDKETTIFVGANNSGKTSAMVALRYFLLSPGQLSLRDITLSNWIAINAIGKAWEESSSKHQSLNELLPVMDVWLNVDLSEIRYVSHIVPTLDWNGGLLGVRLQYSIDKLDKLKAEYLSRRSVSIDASQKNLNADGRKLELWPTTLADFLEERLKYYIDINAYSLDPLALTEPAKGKATPQQLSADSPRLAKNPFKGLIKIDEIAAQRDFSDAHSGPTGSSGDEIVKPQFKRRLSAQLRSYFDRHLDPVKAPSSADYEALNAIQSAELNFDSKLADGFALAFKELQHLGYPGINNPKLKLGTRLKTSDGLKHNSALQYEIIGPIEDGQKVLKLPEDYAGLGYQNLIAIVFMLLSFRDDWMQVGKAAAKSVADDDNNIPPLHLVLIEEPEAHLHAQVQQVFIGNAYKLLRNHRDLGESTDYQTQLVISTHSSHVAHEVDFSSLRYFRRLPAISEAETPITAVSNLSFIFGTGDETQKFVKRYLKATHCDLFFADGIIFVEGQAERILVPHFIRKFFPALSKCYVTILDLGGSHAHSFKPLVEELGLATLVIADLDAVVDNGKKPRSWVKASPSRNSQQKTANPVLKDWHPCRESIDELVDLKDEEHKSETSDGFRLYVAYQKPVPAENRTEEVIPRTFEDALILQNITQLTGLSKKTVAQKIQNIIDKNLSGAALNEALFDLVQSLEKAEFALDCLVLDLQAPPYIQKGLSWFETAVADELNDSELGAV